MQRNRLHHHEKKKQNNSFCGKRACLFLTLSALALLGVSLLQSSANATTWIVTSETDDGARETLRYAVENAAPGDTVSIRVPVVNLTGFLFVNRDLTISGYPSATPPPDLSGGTGSLFHSRHHMRSQGPHHHRRRSLGKLRLRSGAHQPWHAYHGRLRRHE